MDYKNRPKMKTRPPLTILSILATIITGCTLSAQDQAPAPAQKPAYEVKYLELKGNKIYLQGQNKPFTGLGIEKYKGGEPKYQMEYQDGIQHGNTQVWWENGKPHTHQIYHQGKVHGKTTFWFESGMKKSESSYHMGMQHGWTLFWYKSGRKRSAQYWDKGVKTGQFQEWYDAGEVGKEPFKLQGQYKDGKRHGVWVHYRQSGTPDFEHTLEDGKLKRIRLFDEAGKQTLDRVIDKVVKGNESKKSS